MKSFLAVALSLLLSAFALADGRVDFSVEATHTGKLNSRNLVVEFESITCTSATGNATYVEPGTDFGTYGPWLRSWPQNLIVGFGGADQGFPGGGFGQFGWIDYTSTRESLTIEFQGLWIYPIGHQRDGAPSLAVLTMILHADGDVDMWVDIGE